MPSARASVFTESNRRTLSAAMGLRAPNGWLELKGGTIAWKATGDAQGRAVVCLHPPGSGSREFRPLLEHCPAGVRLITFDWPGHGRSTACGASSLGNFPALLFEVLNHLGIARPVLLGSGLGAAVAIRFATAHPMRSLGLVLAQPRELFPPAWNPFASWRLSIRQIQRRASASSLTPSQRQQMRVNVLRRASEGLSRAPAREISLPEEQASLRAALLNLPCPALFAFSRENRRTPLRRYMRILDPLLASSPQHRFTVFAGGFNPIWDEPARFARALNGFIQSLVPFREHRHAWLLSAVDWPARGCNLWKCVHPHCPKELTLPAGQDANADLPN